ncbi:MAG: hypothetical protein ACRETC_06490 [Gammaproteobacteria bacterium]
MAVIKSSINVSIFVLLVVYGGLCSSAYAHNLPSLKGIQESEQCQNAVENEILDKLDVPPVFHDLKSAARWVRTHLPNNIQDALSNAAGDTLVISGFKIDRLAVNNNLFYRVLLVTTSTHLMNLGPVNKKICLGHEIRHARLYLLQAAIWKFFITNKETIVIKKLNKFSGNEDEFGSKLFILMMTLDATKRDWSPLWLNKAKEAQTELGKEIGNQSGQD